jgi:hypothetical protein
MKNPNFFNYVGIAYCELVEMNEKEMQHVVDKHMDWF